MSGPNRREFIRNVGLAAAGGALGSAGETAEKPQGAGADAQEPFPPRINIADDVVRRDDFDLIIVGGGIAGTSCAISAARNGCRVALVHERSMLGGNSSSEVRLFPEDNLHAQPWIKEGGIHEEFHTEERTRNHAIYKEGSMNCHWDLVLYEWVIREPNIKLFLNTHMHRVFMKDDATIRAIYCIQLGTEKELELSAPLFVDATGDGVLAHRAKADYRWGREARSEYGEPLAPDTADEKVMGNTLFFRAEDTGKPVPFKLPDWAVSRDTTAIARRGTGGLRSAPPTTPSATIMRSHTKRCGMCSASGITSSIIASEAWRTGGSSSSAFGLTSASAGASLAITS